MGSVTRQKLVLVTVHLPKRYIQGLEILVAKGCYPSRSEAIRVAIRDLLSRELYSRSEKGEIMLG